MVRAERAERDWVNMRETSDKEQVIRRMGCLRRCLYLVVRRRVRRLMARKPARMLGWASAAHPFSLFIRSQSSPRSGASPPGELKHGLSPTNGKTLAPSFNGAAVCGGTAAAVQFRDANNVHEVGIN